MSAIKDPSVAPRGKKKIEWAVKRMRVLEHLKESRSQSFAGMKVALCLHLEAKTACLAQAIIESGARVSICGSNPLSTQDDVAAALAETGAAVYAWRGESEREYWANLRKALEIEPDFIIDDGGDMAAFLHGEGEKFIDNVKGGCEETTTGLIRLRKMEKQESLRFPVIAVNDAHCKRLFDNRYGTGQSVMDGIMRTTNMAIAGKTVVVAGYGYCGRGVAMRARGLGALVIVTEIDPIRAMEAAMEGYQVMKTSEAAQFGDIFITTTGADNVINRHHFMRMKDGAILANAGHFDVEINKKDLQDMAEEISEVRENVTRYHMPHKDLYLLGEGRLVNLACGDGHPIEIMDLSFAVQFLSLEYLTKNWRELKPSVLKVPGEIDRAIAELYLKENSLSIDA